MLINRVGDDEAGAKEEAAAVEDAHEYQTASELFELMAKKHNFQPDGDETLTTRDLVILYKNIDLGTKLMSSANEFKKKRPNQYVETIVYNDDHDSDSDISENLSNEDLHNVVLVNNERLDLLNNVTPLDKILCHKYGDLELRSSSLTPDYDSHFLFKDPYIKEHLKNFDMFSKPKFNSSPALPTSLLDYVCCRRLEDNYNFDMDNIIRYVQRTIEQLKRISNGDYLTDRAKEKWREVRNINRNDDDTKILKSSTSIPLHVERKITGVATTWDEIIHSEVDIRYLTKILEKKIAIEVPKFLCGSYKVFSKCCEDNVIVRCKSEMDPILEETESESRVDVVFKLERSESGHVVSNISSIMVLQKLGAPVQSDLPQLLPPMPCERQDDDTNNTIEESSTIPESNNDQVSKNESGDNKDITPALAFSEVTSSLPYTSGDGSIQNKDLKEPKNSELDSQDIPSDAGNNSDMCSSFDNCSSEGIIKPDYILEFSSESNYFDSDLQIPANDDTKNENLENHNISTQASSYRLKLYRKGPVELTDASYNITPADQLRLTMQGLNIQSSLPEENMEDVTFATHHKRKSPVRSRLKSPYENKSLALEEKKRKKLLEIRERREKRKLAMGENCKISKSKYGKPSIMPQSSNSVTKLSITNKSFYNSIYGQTVNLNIETKPFKKSGTRNFRKDLTVNDSPDNLSDEDIAAVVSPSTVNSQKYVNRSYFLDDTVTEMMYLQMKQFNGEKDKSSESISPTTMVNSPTNNALNQLMSLCSATEFNMGGNPNPSVLENKHDEYYKHPECPEPLLERFRNQNPAEDVIIVPLNTPHRNDNAKKMDASKTSADFRKSIDKIYNLMKKNTKLEENKTIIREVSPERDNLNKFSPVQYTKSGTSIKNQPASSNLSSVSFEKDNQDPNLENNQSKYRKNADSITVPKVIICTKSQLQKCETANQKNHRMKPKSPLGKAENPLKALSQIINHFNNVQKIRQKSGNESIKSNRKEYTNTKCTVRQSSGKKARPEPQPHEVVVDQQPKQKEKKYRGRDEKTKSNPQMDNPKNQTESKNCNKTLKREIIHLLDDYKEARGEAVRGPSKFSSRLNSLAQPKKSYVQANIEDCQMRYGKNVMSDRLQKLNNAPAPAPLPTVEKNKLGSGVTRYKQRRLNNDVSPTGPTKLPQPISSIEKRKIKFAPEITPPAITPSTASPSSCEPVTNVKPSILKKKMVAVESYIKTHYGNSKSSAESAQIFLEGLKSRVPVIPTAYKLGPIVSVHTVEESAIIGSTLHNIIETMIETQQKEGAQDLKINSSTGSNDANMDNNEIDNFKHEKAEKSNEKPVRHENITRPQAKFNTCIEVSNELKNQQLQSATELEKLENALTRQLSVSTIQKRLRMKNLTLTPKQSLQQVLVLQSGDVGSFIFQSPQDAPNIKNRLKSIVNLQDSKNENRGMGFNFPIQMLKVNYAFPIKSINLKDFDNVRQTAEKESAAQSDMITIRTNLLQPNQIGEIHKYESHIKKDKIDVSHSRLEIYKPSSSRDSLILKQNNSQKDCTTRKRSCSEKIIAVSPKLVEEENNNIVEIPKTKSKDKIENTGDNEVGISDTNIASGSVDYTSSLDILTGLLNEIQKITTCQTMMANNEVHPNNMVWDDRNSQKNIVDFTDYTLRKCKDVISITSLDELRQLESNDSFYSYYISNDDDQLSNKIKIIPDDFDSYDKSYKNVDKENNVNISSNKLVDRFTDKPSIFIPVSINHSTSVSNSLIGIFSQPSNQSIISINETTYTTSLTTRTKIIELPPTQAIKMGTETCDVKSKREGKQQLGKIIFDKIKFEKKSSKHLELKRTLEMERKFLNFEPNGLQEVVVINDKNYDESALNASMKMKRDVLVTVYSILVFTVFAALSFPKMLYDE